MYNNQFMVENWIRQRDKIDEMIKNYQSSPSNPINNFITTNQQTPQQNNLVEWRILNENEEVDNLYVANKTLFINDNLMILKGTDGKLEKWEVKKIWPIDKKDEEINQLKDEVKKLKEMINNEYSSTIGTIGASEQSNVNDDGDIEPKPKTNGGSVSKQDNTRTGRTNCKTL